MRNLFKNEDIKKNIFIYANSGIIIVLFFFVLNNLGPVTLKIKEIFSIMMPFIWGIIIAFLLSSIANKYENILDNTKLSFKTKRLIAVFLALITMFMAIGLFLLVLVPQIIISATQLATSMSEYIISLTTWLNDLAIEYGIRADVVNYLLSYSKGIEEVIKEIINLILGWFQINISHIMNMTFATLNSVGSFIIGIIIAVYMLIDKEHLFRQFNKLGRAFLKDDVVFFIKDVIFLSIEKFNRFIIGKLIDSLIIGVICFVAMNLIKLDYSILISFVIGLTNIIPVFGPFIGAIPCAFILLIVDPLQALWFVILIIILQQVDGNIIGPSILGDSMGLSSMWIMFAIIVGGGFFGIVGMFLGVPTFSVVYHLLKERADKVIALKELYKKTS